MNILNGTKISKIKRKKTFVVYVHMELLTSYPSNCMERSLS
jgi:hypothetical protein